MNRDLISKILQSFRMFDSRPIKVTCLGKIGLELKQPGVQVILPTDTLMLRDLTLSSAILFYEDQIDLINKLKLILREEGEFSSCPTKEGFDVYLYDEKLGIMKFRELKFYSTNSRILKALFYLKNRDYRFL